MRKTKIVCTVGPACDDEEVMRGLCLAGMNVARLNFSHGTHEDHLKKITMIKKIREELGLPIAIMLDTKGPEYRIKTYFLLYDGKYSRRRKKSKRYLQGNDKRPCRRRPYSR